MLKTGINHFGEILDQVLLQRMPSLPAPQVVFDGSKVNSAGPDLGIVPIMGGCWQHAQAYFWKAKKNFPEETKEIRGWFKKIFEVDRQTHEMGALERPHFLQEHGGPYVDKIKAAMDGQANFFPKGGRIAGPFSPLWTFTPVLGNFFGKLF